MLNSFYSLSAIVDCFRSISFVNDCTTFFLITTSLIDKNNFFLIEIYNFDETFTYSYILLCTVKLEN